MKTFVTCLVSFWLAGLAGAQTSVTSPNIIGFVKVDLPADQMQIIATPLNPANSGTNNPAMTLDQILRTNKLTASYDSFSADNVYLWTGAGYQSAWLTDDGWGGDGGPVWKWVYFDPGSPVPALCATNNAFDVKVGEAMWLLHRTTTTTIYLTGEIPQAAVTTTTLDAGLTMIGNPYPVVQSLDQLIGTHITGITASSDSFSADNVYLWTGAGYRSAWLTDDGWGGDGGPIWKWVYFDPASPVPALCATNNLFTVTPGQGLWYNARGGAFSWPVARPY